MSRKKSTFFADDWKKGIGRRIREIRGFDLNQEEFAKVLALTQTTVSKLEKGEILPTAEVLVRLSQFSGKSVDWILMGGPVQGS